MPVYKNRKGLIKSLNSLVVEYEKNKFDILLVDDSPIPELINMDFSSFPFEIFLIVNGR